MFGLFAEFGLKLKIFSSRKERIWFMIITLIVGIAWDNFSISRGHWVFPVGGNLGPKIGIMPIEEYLFILIIPYSLLAFKALLSSQFKRRGT
jgi:lycopene cyclase domain-containing protein